jgi:hypothetical protein
VDPESVRFDWWKGRKGGREGEGVLFISLRVLVCV